MRTNIEMIRSLDDAYTPETKHVVSIKEIHLINQKLCLDEMDEIALHNLRDMIVMYYSATVETMPKNEVQKRFDVMDKMSAITCVIDLKLHNLANKE